MSEIIGKKSSGMEKPRKPRRQKPAYSEKELADALKVMQSLGFKVTPPSTEEEKAKQKASMKKLGFSEAVRKVTEVEMAPKVLKAYLGAAHVIAGVVYGPKEINLPLSEESLFRTLLHQDQMSRAGHLDTAEYNPRSRCFMIGERKNKVEVSEAAFNSDAVWNVPSFAVGAMDIAGFNPSMQSENRTF